MIRLFVGDESALAAADAAATRWWLMPSRLYFDADDGMSYRVYDVDFTQHKTKRVPLGHPSAKYRIFVPEQGRKRSHMFARGESRAITDMELEQQLRSAQYLHEGSKFDGSELTPGAPPR